MCEIFALTARRTFKPTKYLKNFFAHGTLHPNGWGIYTYDRRSFLYKEPVKSNDSLYINNNISNFNGKIVLAHIRKATIGHVGMKNTHPFQKKDKSGRVWTLIHNGTIFESNVLNKYLYTQEGETDSERILLYIIDRINEKIINNKDAPADIRFKILEEVIKVLSPSNKLNLCIFDGEYTYVHCNAKETLYSLKNDDFVMFSTTPLTDDKWERISENILHVYKGEKLIFKGERHEFNYVEDYEKIKMLYLGFSGL